MRRGESKYYEQLKFEMLHLKQNNILRNKWTSTWIFAGVKIDIIRGNSKNDQNRNK